MKSWLGKMWAKASAFALTLVFAALTALGGIGIGVLVSSGVFLDDGTHLRRTLYQEQCYDSLSMANDYLCAQLDSVGLLDRSYYFVNDEGSTVASTAVEYDPEAAQQLLSELPRLFADAFSRELSSCQLVVSDPDTGETYLANFDLTEDDKLLYDTQELYVYHLSASTGLSAIQVAITATLLEKSGQAPSYSYLVCSWLLAHTGLTIFLTVLCGLLTLFCFCFSMASAGHWQNHEGIHLTWLDKIPADVWIIALLSAFFIGWNTFYSEWGQVLFCAALIPVTLLFLCVFAAQCKAGTVIRGSLTARVLRLLWRILRSVTLWLWRIVTGIPLVWKTALVTAALAFLEFILYVSPSRDPLFLVVKVLEILAVLAIALNLRTLEKNGKQLSEGDLSTPVDTKRLFGAFRRYGQAMNRLQSGMESAVQEQMRAERMKTELITNVSHDIKTPLTSIVNYVDLLKKENLDGQAAEYIEVLDRQSRRLKKLTEDLVEASKASTGNLKVQLAPTDMGELAAQAVAEYEEKLENAHLEAVINGGDTPLFAMVDGNLTWRVLSNLLSNACKYSQPHTRVYIDIKKEKDTVILSMKNISRDALNIPAEELMERFVRGDSSRHTEGSGLGLNIAQSLVGLQKGTFSLEIEGDLFKAFVAFPATEPPAPPAEEMPEKEMPTDALPMEDMPIEEMQEETEKGK